MFDRSTERRDARFRPVRLLVLAFTITFCAPMVFSQNNQKSDPRSSRGLIRNLPQAFQGYTIVSPLRSTNTFLVDMKGEVVHTWKGSYTPTFGVYLLDNGNLLRAGHDPNNFYYREGGQGGIIQEISWDGTVVWEYKYSDRHHAQHHDIEPLPNGNVLLLAWEKKTGHQALIAGRDPKMITADGLWPEHLVEVRPIRPNGGEIVWEWHVWDHLIQDRDPKLRFFGKPEEHPERIYINGDFGRRRDSEEEMAQLRALGYIADSPPGGWPTDPRPESKQRLEPRQLNFIQPRARPDSDQRSAVQRNLGHRPQHDDRGGGGTQWRQWWKRWRSSVSLGQSSDLPRARFRSATAAFQPTRCTVDTGRLAGRRQPDRFQ